MKILHFTHTDISSDNRILKEISSLLKLPHSKVYGVGVFKNKGDKSKIQNTNLSIKSINLYSKEISFIPSKLRYFLIAIELFFKLVYEGLIVKPTVVHCHDTPVLLSGVFIKFILRIKLIYDAHELETNKNGQSEFISRLIAKIEKYSWPFIDHFISVSPSIISWYHKNYGFKPSTLVLNSPLYKHTHNYKERFYSRYYFHEKYSVSKDKLIFLYLGLLVPGRSINEIVKTFSNKHVKSHVVFVGHGTLQHEISLISKRNNKIHLHPSVPHQDVVSLSRSADVGLCFVENVSLSDYYCLPNKLFEYAFAGLPILASNFPDISKIINKYNLGYCCSLDKNKIAKIIQKIEKEGIILKTKNLDPLTWEHQEEKLLKIYEDLDRKKLLDYFKVFK